MMVLHSSVEWSWTNGGSCQRDGHVGPGHHQDDHGCHHDGHTLVMVVLVIIKMVMAVILVIVVLDMMVHTPAQSTHLVHFLPSRSLLLKKIQKNK